MQQDDTTLVEALLGAPRPAVVVGAAQGIGYAVAEELCRLSMARRIALVDIDGEQLDGAAATLRAAYPGVPVEAIAADVRDEDAVAGAVASFDEPALGVVVAGIFEGGPLVDMDRASFERVIDVNLVGACMAARVMARRFAQVGGGSIVAVSSIGSRVPRLEQAAYAATKSGLVQAMRVLGLETAPAGVRVNVVAPGPTNTRLVQRSFDPVGMAAGDLERYRTKIPRGRIATTREIGTAVAVMLSKAMDHVYLQELVVDGGETLGMS